MGFLSLFTRLYFQRRYQKIEKMSMNPHFFQEKTWGKLISKNKNTLFGIKHRCPEISTFSQFQKQIPIQAYEQIQPYIEKIIRGENNILSADPVRCFAKSSGTTDHRSKYIPMTLSFLKNCHYAGGKDALALYYQQEKNANLSSGKNLSLGGSVEENIACKKKIFWRFICPNDRKSALFSGIF